MENYFKSNTHAPVLHRIPETGKHINIAPLLLAMFELANEEDRNSPEALAVIVSDAIRYLATNVPNLEKEQLPDYHKMIQRLYDLHDMFKAMFIVG